MPLHKRTPKLVKHKGRYSAVFYNAETQRRHWHALGTDKKTIAQRRYNSLFSAYESGNFDPSKDRFQPGVLTIERAVEAFLKSRSHLRQATQSDYERFLNMVMKMLPAGILASSIEAGDLRKVVRRPPSPETQRGYHRRLGVFCRWLVREGHIKENPLREVKKPKKQDRIPVFLTRENYRHLQTTIDKAEDPADFEMAVRFTVNSGLRLSEVCGLTWGHLDRSSGRMRVTGKGGKTRPVPIFPAAGRVLSEMERRHMGRFGTSPSKGSYLFLGPEGKGMDRYWCSHRFKGYAVSAGFDDVSFHTLRHTFASWAVMGGVSIYIVSKWLGHTDVSTTMVYAHLAPDFVPDAAVEALK
ncbi:MAG TPA: tyrosine-type recombinase/integrase [Rhodothermales bacterium]|nr:tyrosine-type recombinase/integrase [Rhodothermales bacterium]